MHPCTPLTTHPPSTSPPIRYYHSNALLLPSGDIWVAGSEQGDCVDTCATGGRSPPDQEYRAELLQLPYAFQACTQAEEGGGVLLF